MLGSVPERRSSSGVDLRAAYPVRTACGVLAQIQGAGWPVQHLLRFRDAIMRIVILGGRDPSDEDTWSGTPKSLIGSLRRAGHDVTAIGPLPPIETPWRLIKARYYRHVLGKDYVTIRDPAAVWARTAEANRLLRDEGEIDAVVALHPADAAYLECRGAVDLHTRCDLASTARFLSALLPKRSCQGDDRGRLCAR